MDSDNRPGIKATMIMDCLGCLQVWEGEGLPVRHGKNIYTMDARGSDLFIQDSQDQTEWIAMLSAGEALELDGGWCVTVSVPDHYLEVFAQAGR